MPLRLVVFDMDGTLVDSECLIAGSLVASFSARGHVPPAPDAIRGIVGLALVEAIGRLSPHLPADEHAALADGYREAFTTLRTRPDRGGESPFPGALELVEELRKDGILLGIATGKSRRGLDAVLRSYELERSFVTIQTVDSAPGKPHPGMVLNALAETGVPADEAVVVGDTTFDVEMARNAGVHSIGVGWGNHAASQLEAAGADTLVQTMAELRDELRRHVRQQA